MYKQEIPPGIARRDPLWNEISLETDRGHPVPKSAEHIAEFSPYGLVELEEVPVEDGSDFTKDDLVNEFRSGNESVKESENRRNSFAKVGPEVVIDDVKCETDNESGYDASCETFDPLRDLNLRKIRLLNGDQLLEGEFCFRILLGGSGSSGIRFLVYSTFELNVLVFHVHSP